MLKSRSEMDYGGNINGPFLTLQMCAWKSHSDILVPHQCHSHYLIHVNIAQKPPAEIGFA